MKTHAKNCPWHKGKIVKKRHICKCDGYHTFDDLYEHRIVLYIALCKLIQSTNDKQIVWKSKKHSDGSEWDGWFILGIYSKAGEQITYHLPIKYWGQLDMIPDFNKAPDWDGHTPDDVIKRLNKLQTIEKGK